MDVYLDEPVESESLNPTTGRHRCCKHCEGNAVCASRPDNHLVPCDGWGHGGCEEPS